MLSLTSIPAHDGGLKGTGVIDRCINNDMGHVAAASEFAAFKAYDLAANEAQASERRLSERAVARHDPCYYLCSLGAARDLKNSVLRNARTDKRD